ncbi:hypothetical protein D9619_002805 [Psilocybe cf. subviscida]|uniref:2-dehydropantoate 2-reductase n=1 Tax=Psilocybe cf. subviscida TaxID=2480587 RepID=A0A8H5ETL8_9AGAR|nr:hypothetical protein D9619_002805 [Psilocybe cf. subviscida]
MHLHVLGLGSIGCLLAHTLRRALPEKHAISLIHKSITERQYFFERRVIRVEREGEVTEASGFTHEVSSEVTDHETPAARPEPGEDAVTRNDNPISSLFVALKAQQATEALHTLAPRLTENSTVILLQNGMGVYDEIVRKVFNNPSKRPHFILGTNNHGAFVKHHFHVAHAGIGAIDFGIMADPQNRNFERGLYEGSDDPRLRLSDITYPDDPQSEHYTSLRDSVAALLVMSDLNTSWLPIADVHRRIQRKLAVNAAINPVTALLRCRNGELFKHQTATNLLRQVCAEASAVFEAQWEQEQDRQLRELLMRRAIHSVADVPKLPFPNTLYAGELEKEALAVARKTAGNISSMLEDIRRGRRTEIDYINGYLVDMGREYNVPTPVNETLLSLLKLRSDIPLDQFL